MALTADMCSLGAAGMVRELVQLWKGSSSTVDQAKQTEARYRVQHVSVKSRRENETMKDMFALLCLPDIFVMSLPICMS
jgi:hypothetical protein